jgi:hypothetical protein
MLLQKENVNVVQRHWRNESGKPSSTCVTVTQSHDKCGADGTVDKEHSEGLAVQLTMEVLRQC